MSEPMYLRMSMCIDAASEDAEIGYEAAKDAWFAAAEGESQDESAAKFAAGLMELYLVTSKEALAACLAGVGRFLYEAAKDTHKKQV